MPCRVLLLADRPLGMNVLKLLRREPQAKVVGVVSPPPRQEWWGYSVFRQWCKSWHLRWYSDESDLVPLCTDRNPDLVLSILHRKIVPEGVVNQFPCVNLHCAPLPWYRGYNSTLHAILNGEAQFGPTLHVMDATPDTGPILECRLNRVDPTWTNRDLYRSTHRVALQMVMDHLPALLNLSYETTPQNGKGTYYGKRDLPSREVDLSWSTEQISRHIRAFYFPPFEPAYLNIDGIKYFLTPEVL